MPGNSSKGRQGTEDAGAECDASVPGAAAGADAGADAACPCVGALVASLAILAPFLSV